MKMERILKLIPTIALVSVIGVALANQGQTSLCTVEGTTGYGTPLDMNAAPGAPSNIGIVNLGNYGTDFECEVTTDQCHYVYNAAEPDPTKRWTKCLGTYQPNQ